MMKSRREFIKSTCLGGPAFAMQIQNLSCSKNPNQRPNVILILTDDQGYGDFGVKGNPIIKTPNIDAMANRSAEMKNFYVHPVCAPTRACLMTGRYNYRTRCIDTYVGRAMMEPDEVTIAEVLRDNDYATGIFGKWHLGDNYPMRPMEQGFEESLVHRGGGIGQPADPPEGEGKYTDPVLFHNGKQVQEYGFCTDVYFTRGMDWMERNVKADRNFLLYLPTNAPHSPFNDVPQRLYADYKRMNLNNDQFPQQQGHRLLVQSDVDSLARIYAMISNIDENVGRLFDKLEDLDIVDNTIVLFMVDNGPNTQRYVAGFKEKKGSVYEGGIRSPLFIHWPRILNAGMASDRVAAHIDIFPTILDACDIPKPKNLKFDGKSFLPLLTAPTTEWVDREIVIQSHRGDKPVLYHNFAIRNQRWKLLHASGFGRENFIGDPSFELFDMVNDPYEMQDVASDHPDVVADLKRKYERWFDDVSSSRPNNYDPPRIFIGTEHENPVVLTRQDWRHVSGRPWGKNSNGFWMLYAPTPGEYDFRIRFKHTKADGKIKLEIGDIIQEKSYSADSGEATFKNVGLNKGTMNLQVTLTENRITKGPWQVDVIRL